MYRCNLDRRVRVVVALIVIIGLSSFARSDEAEQVVEAVAAEAKVAVIQAERVLATVKAKAADKPAKKKAEPAKKEGDKKDGKEKEAKKKKAGNAIKALFDAFVPAAPALRAAPQPMKHVSLKKLGGVTEENVKKLEEAVNKNRNAKAHLKQFEPRFKQFVQAELRLVHDVCKLKRSQFDSIKTAADLAGRACALEAAQYQAGMENGFGGRQADHPNPYVLVEDTLIAAVQKTLPEKLAEEYEQEIEARRSFEKVADAEKIISCLDKDLALSPDQRAAMVKPIADAWKYKWKSNLQVMEHNGNQYLPNIPKTAIKKLLTEEQRTRFATMSRHGNVFFGMQLNDLPQMNGKLAKLEEELEFAPEDESS